MNKFAMHSIEMGKMTRNSTVMQAFLLSIITTAAILFWHFHHDFDFWDEGFLWYGVQRVMLGEVPMRDFMAYDPGRYYWSAALMTLWGNNGLLALRTTIAFFQLGALFFGLLLIARSAKKVSFPYLLLSLLTLAAWMFPRWKLFDIGLSVFLIAILAFLVERPTYRRYFLTGLCVGLVAVFGRNHGVYGAAGSLGVMLWLAFRRDDEIGNLKAFSYWMLGVLVGYIPILMMLVFVPGFALAFWKSILFIIDLKATNLPLPTPWPWLVPIKQLPFKIAVDQVLIGLFFISTIVFGVLTIAWVVWQKSKRNPVPPVLVACAFLAFPYAHDAFSRAASLHLSQGMFPALIGTLVILLRQPGRIKWVLAVIVCGTSFWVGYYENPDWYCLRGGKCVKTNIAGSEIKVDIGAASNIAMFDNLVKNFAPNGRSFYATPNWSGAYAMYDRQSPVWESYALFPRSSSFEKKEIARIKAADPGFVLIYDFPLDGRDELRFRNTHPLINQYVIDHFDPIVGYTNNPAYHLYKDRQSIQ